MNQPIPIRLLQKAVKKAWDKRTCYPGDLTKWNENLPETGQCAVTALVINDLYGGQIVFNEAFDHFWNILPDGRELDLTKGQFNCKITGEKVLVTRDAILYSPAAKRFRTNSRYHLLKKRVDALLTQVNSVY
jgi:hypothetical protein